MSGYRDEYRRVEGGAFWTFPRATVALVLLLALIYGLGFLATGGDLVIYRFWAPKQENAKRVVFKNTQSHVEGMTDYLSSLEFQYQSATGEQKEATRRLIITESRNVDFDKLPADLQVFINSIR